MVRSNNDADPDFPVLAVAVPTGILLIIILIITVACAVCKCSKEKKEENIKEDKNNVYGIYQFGENYEREYSTNEIVDRNLYYE